MTDKTASVRTEEKEPIDKDLVNKGRYVFIGTVKRGDGFVAAMADRTLCSEADIKDNVDAIKSHKRAAFNNAAAVAPNLKGKVAYLKADELEARKEELHGADKETYKQAIHRIEEREKDVAIAPIASSTRRLTAIPLPSGR